MSGCENGKRMKAAVLAACLSLTVCLSGCTGAETDQGDHQVLVEQEETSTADYTLVTVSRGEVVHYENMWATYTQQDSHQMSFDVDGRRIAHVYVEEGDMVKKGDLLAELDGGSRQDEIEELEYRIARNKLLLEQVDITEDYEISRRWLENIYNGNTYGTDGIPDLQKSNEYTREDCRDAIALDEQRLALIKKSVQESCLYADMDGKICYVRMRLYGSTSVKGQTVIEIMDSSQCVFQVSDMKYAPYIKEGQQMTFSSTAIVTTEPIYVVPYQMDEWTDAMYFTLVDAGEAPANLEAGVSGPIQIILEESKNALKLPNDTVQSADGKWYVYTVGDDGNREVKWVEIGIRGNNETEIISGLEEGEKVVRR